MTLVELDLALRKLRLSGMSCANSSGRSAPVVAEVTLTEAGQGSLGAR